MTWTYNSMDTKLSKFGGSSLASADRIAHVAENIILKDEERKLIVVSAFGKESPSDIRVTNQLIELASIPYNSKKTASYIGSLQDKLTSISQGLHIGDEIVAAQIADLEGRVRAQFLNPLQRSDYLKAWGEYTSALVLTKYLKDVKKVPARFVDPKEILVASDHFGDAVLLPSSDEKIKRVLAHAEGISIIPGFYGFTQKSEIATLPRGGSDTTGGKIAGVLGLDVYENFTDVDFIKRASDVKNALPIQFMTYDEAMELAYLGFGVLKDEAIKPCMETSVPIHVRNTFKPNQEGTWIMGHREADEHDITGIAYKPGFRSLNIRKVLHGRDKDHSLGSYVVHTEMGVTGSGEFPIEHIATGVSNISFLIPQEYFTTGTVNRLTKYLSGNFQIPPTDITPNYDPISLISVVGLGMAKTPGVCARVTAAIALQGVSIGFSTQGASELSMIYGVSENGAHPMNAQKCVQSSGWQGAESGQVV